MILLIFPILNLFTWSEGRATVTQEDEDDELVLLQVLFRHGDRSPTRTFPTDQHAGVWTRGLGQLTKQGIWRSYNLGKYLKKTFIDDLGFLPPTFNVDEVRVRSTGYDRTIMTAQAVMTGLYPPATEEEKWNPENPLFPWQPIPIHSVPKKDDLILRYGNRCPRYWHLKDEVLKHNPELKAFEKNETNRKALDVAKEHSGLTDIEDWKLYQLYDTLLVEQLYGLTMPAWADETVMKVLERLTVLDYQLMTSTTEMARLAAGNLLGELLNNIENKMTGDENKQKAFLYSAHDSTIMALLGVLEVPYDALPEYNAFIAMELFKGTDGFKVKVSYRTDASVYPEDPKPIILPACREQVLCPVEKVREYYRKMEMIDYKSECQPDPE